MKKTLFVILLAFNCKAFAEDTWFDALIEQRETARTGTTDEKKAVPLPDFGNGKYTFAAWIKTDKDGSIFAKAAPQGRWSRGGKSLFLAGGRVCFDIGWVGCLEGSKRITDGKWRHVAFSGGSPQKIYIDGKLDVEKDMEATPDVKGHVFKLGYTSTDFPEGGRIQFSGEMDDVRIYGRVLSADEIRSLAAGKAPGAALVAHWPMDGDTADASGSLNHATMVKPGKFVDGKVGKALSFASRTHLVVKCGEGENPDASLWRSLEKRFSDETSTRQMTWEREDGIWGADWRTVSYADVARRYAVAAQRPSSIGERITKLAATTKTADQLKAVRQLYQKSRRYDQLLEKIAQYKLKELRQTIITAGADGPQRKGLLSRLDAVEAQALQWQDGPPAGEAFDAWKKAVAELRRDVLVAKNPLMNFDKLVFIKRYTYHSSHFYTDFIDGVGNFGGNLCILDMTTGKATELLPDMKGGIFGRFDLSFDAKTIVFDWKKEPREGFRIFEVNIDGSGLRQLTYRPDDEDERIAKYDNSKNGGTARMYFHQTDDMHPCYLPDGRIVFTSSRCEYGTLCDSPDHLASAVLHRIDADGKNMVMLTNSAVSEFSPSIMEDGWILYTRWEYVDKGQLGIKCLWAMRPDGSGTKEIFGNDIQFPPTMLHGRQIPGHSNLFVMLGTPHYPQSGIGTVIRVDTTKNIRTREPMTYITPHVDIRQEPGWNHLVNGRWVRHTNGPLYMDPYPLSKSQYLVSHNPDKKWNDMRAYGLYLIDESGNHELIHKDAEFSCWQPTPLRPRKRPPVLPPVGEPKLAKKKLAVCMVHDVYHGMEGIERGEVKWIRILEQIPRPWACRRTWSPAVGHTGLISRGSALAPKALYGVVPVEEDGSAHFYVPADRNIYFEALDENYMELQRERTYVNYRPGEKRSCIGCHETNLDSPPLPLKTPLAMLQKPVMPQPQPGDKTAARPIHYPTDVQPVLDKHCVRCHGSKNPAGRLDLTGELTQRFSRSYESILGRRLVKTFDEGSDWGGTPYAPPKSVGSHASRFIAQVKKGCTGNDKELPLGDFVKLTTWVDANAVYYGSYWGRRDVRYKDHPNFRPAPTLEEALSTVCPTPEDER